MTVLHNFKVKIINLKLYIVVRFEGKEYPLQSLSDLTVESSQGYLIPGNCYQTWETKRFGKSHVAAIERFRQLNPEISWFLYDGNQRDEYMETFWKNHPIYDVYNRARFGVIKADIFRYCILFERGGYYFDISKGCETPLRSLHNINSNSIITFEKNLHDFEMEPDVKSLLLYPQNLIGQWGFGFVKEHPFLRTIIESIVENSSKFAGIRFKDPKRAVWDFTGPRAFTKAVHSAINSELAQNTCQSGIDFNLTGIFQLPGAEVRHFTRRHYWDYENVSILEESK